MKRFTCFAFALALVSASATAQVKKEAALQSSTSVLVNGYPVQGKVLDIEGKHFVAVEDLAQQCCRGMRARETVSQNEVHCLF